MMVARTSTMLEHDFAGTGILMTVAPQIGNRPAVCAPIDDERHEREIAEGDAESAQDQSDDAGRRAAPCYSSD
ncbi:MAG TPA: hypothetical protein VMU69_10740 [Bradyrhizobium sp.]|nr:hypothetical protein [Bradyrhizobium sp.]